MHRWMTLFWIVLSLPIAARAARAEPQSAAPEAAPAPQAPAAATADARQSTMRTVGLPPELADRLTPEQLTQLALETQRERHKAIPGELVPIVMFLVLLLGVLIVQLAGVRRERERQRTLQVMVEKGAAIPPELIAPPVRAPQPEADLRRGLVIAGTGLGLAGFFLAFSPQGMPQGLWSVGLVPLFIGLGYLIVYFVAKRRLERQG
jgi:hypothetical protein